MEKYYRAKANINLDAIHHNFQLVKDSIKEGTQLMAVIKADGYGHGARQIAKYCDDLIDRYAVAVVEEGIDLRVAGFTKPINLLGYADKLQYEDVINYNLIPAIFSYDMAKDYSDVAVRMGKNAIFHLALDTGMSRIGFADTDESVEIIKKIAKLPNIKIDGMFTHLYRADEVDKSIAIDQFNRYMTFKEKLEKNGIHLENCHVSNSAAIMELPNMNLNIVRSGIINYGLYPSHEMREEDFKIIPAMELKTSVSFVKTIGKGVAVGYGGTFVADKDTVVATVPVGYADGYPRSLSNNGQVLIKGKRANIIGRVCMDQFMIDVTDIPNVKVGDTVTLVGRDGDEFLSCEEVAEKSGSFNYEFVCDVSKRIPRVYYFNGEIVDEVHYVGLK